MVLPVGVDDPQRPSGGNVYDRQICVGLGELGWVVIEHLIAGDWPTASDLAHEHLRAVLAGISSGSTVLVDGLIGSAAPEQLVPESQRLRVVVLVHLPLGIEPLGELDAGGEPLGELGAREQAVLTAAAAVVTTGRWTRQLLLKRYRLLPSSVHTVEPGVHAAELAPATAAGTRLLCVAAVVPGKGHDILLAALELLRNLPWTITCVGSLTVNPELAELLQQQIECRGLLGRVSFVGTRSGSELDAAYRDADLLVLASRGETYGMVISEALARGLPVVATDVGGVGDALGTISDATRPGILVSPKSPVALAKGLRSWLSDANVRTDLRVAARERRSNLLSWSTTSTQLALVLDGVAS